MSADLSTEIVDGQGNGHLSQCVRGAGKAGVVRANGRLDAVERTFRYYAALGNISLGDILNGSRHGVVIISRGDNHVDA